SRFTIPLRLLCTIQGNCSRNACNYFSASVVTRFKQQWLRVEVVNTTSSRFVKGRGTVSPCDSALSGSSLFRAQRTHSLNDSLASEYIDLYLAINRVVLRKTTLVAFWFECFLRNSVRNE